MTFPGTSRFNLNLEQQRKRAKDLLRMHREGRLEAAVRIARHLPRARNQSATQVLASPCTLSEAQLVVAREAGCSSWPLMKRLLEDRAPERISDETLIDAALAGNDAAIRAALAQDSPVARGSLSVAVALAQAEAALELLGADPSLALRRSGRRNWTPLLYLCFSRYRRGEREATEARFRVIERLLEPGADVNVAGRQPGFDDGTAWCALEGLAGCLASPELMRCLLQAGADAKRTGRLLEQAVRGGNTEVLQLALDAEPPWGQVTWALSACVELDQREMARMLVDRAIAPRVTEPALLEAIHLGRDPELIEILLGEDTTPELSGPVRQAAYRSALRHGHHAAAALLSRRGAKEREVTTVDRVMAACVTEDRPEVLRLLEGAPDARRALRATDHRMVSWAVRSGRHRVLLLLLEAGLDPNVPDKDGNTPLHLAVRSGSAAMLEALLRAGADVNARNFQAQTPLEYALALPEAQARERLTRHLLDAGASPARMGQFLPRNTPLDEALRQAGAIEREDPELLFERAADAVAQGDVERLRELLDEEPALVYARAPTSPSNPLDLLRSQRHLARATAHTQQRPRHRRVAACARRRGRRRLQPVRWRRDDAHAGPDQLLPEGGRPHRRTRPHPGTSRSAA